MTYEEKIKEYQDKYCFADFGISGEDRIKLIMLICGITQSIRKNNPNTKAIDVINKIIVGNYNGWQEKISFTCEAFLLNSTFHNYPTFGLTNTKDMVSEIKRISEFYLPF